MALSGLVAGTLGAVPARAEAPNYSYVEAGYLNVNEDDLSGSGDNWFAGGAIGLGKHFHAIGFYTNGDLGTDVSQTYWRAGLGWHGLLGEKADIVAEAYYVDQTVDGPGPSNSDTGYRVTGGIRWLPIKFFELDGFANFNDVQSDHTDTTWEARAIINIWRLGFGGDYEKFDTADQWNAFVRFNFGKH
jgi:hypothetical protein